MKNKTIFQQVFDKFGGIAATSRLTGIPQTTIYSIKSTGRSSYAMRLLFNLLLIAGTGTIKSAAKRTAKNQ